MKRSEVAEKTGLDIETIRYYESQKIISEPARKDNGYREYSAKNVEELRFVQHCRSLGLNIAEIKKLKELSGNPQDCSHADAIIKKHLEQIEIKIKELTHLSSQLKSLANSCSTPGMSTECEIVKSLVEASQGGACHCH